jgi:hypothetical protein
MNICLIVFGQEEGKHWEVGGGQRWWQVVMWKSPVCVDQVHQEQGSFLLVK